MGSSNMKSTFSIILFSGILFFWVVARTEPIEDKLALIDFATNVKNQSKPLNWELRDSACSYWIGITCSLDKSSIVAIQLPGYGFEGPVPLNTLSRISNLQILSLRSNNFTGLFPTADFSKLKNLANIDLQFNNFEGPLPLDFSVWRNLSVINLSHNFFNGSIPSSLSNLTHLNALNLENNLLSGEIPDLNVVTLQLLDLSYNNNLTGNVPESLVRFPLSAFSGTQLSFQVPPLKPPIKKPRRKSSKKLLAIILGCSVTGFVIIALLMYLCFSKSRVPSVQEPRKKDGFRKKEKKAVSNSSNNGGGGGGKLVFFDDCNLVFDLEDLLRASAEVLGKGSFGTTYKAALEDGVTVAVKRLKEATVAKREFELQMEAVGKIKHENVAPIRAYYYSKDEKLMVYDYYGNGSLFTMLHGKKDEKHVPLDWETRLRFAIGTARGLAHIHSESSGKLVHGNIKASNIFLNPQQQHSYGCISDLGLATLISSSSTSSALRAPGYRAPELTADARKITQASDVYSYGVLLLELLTGKSPIHCGSGGGGGDEVVHLVRWVHSVVHEEWTAEVFDVELLRQANIEEQMVEMLQIGMSCVSRMPEQRPKMVDVLKMVEDINGDLAASSSNQE